MKGRIYLICRKFEPGTGSYSGMFEKFSKIAKKKGYVVVILSGHDKDTINLSVYPYATHWKFPLPKKNIPILGSNWHYLSLRYFVKEYFKHIKIDKNTIIIANCLAALGVTDKIYYLRMGQPAHIVLKNMNMKKNQTFKTKIGRQLHYCIQGILEKIVVKKSKGLILTSIESRKNIINRFGGKNKPYFIPQSGVSI